MTSRRAIAIGVLAGGLLTAGCSNPFRSAPSSCQTPPGRHSQEQILNVRGQVDAITAGNISSVGNGANAVQVALLPGREKLAAELLGRFGDAVEITVGGTAYCGRTAVSPRCPDQPGSDDLPPGLHLTLRLDRASIRATDSLGGQLTVRNDAETLFEMDAGQPLTASLVRPGSRSVVARFNGPIAGTGLGLHLRNGDEQTIRVIVGTARCDGHRGSAVSPGTYGVRVGIGPNEGPPGYLAPEVPLTIDPR